MKNQTDKQRLEELRLRDKKAKKAAADKARRAAKKAAQTTDKEAESHAKDFIPGRIRIEVVSSLPPLTDGETKALEALSSAKAKSELDLIAASQAVQKQRQDLAAAESILKQLRADHAAVVTNWRNLFARLA